MKKILAVLLALLLAPSVNAATVSISQVGADPGTIMKGNCFTITVSGLSGAGTAALVDLPSGISVDEGTSKSFSSSTTSVSWTTAMATLSLSNQKIYATITVAGSPSSAESSPFDIVLPPSLSATIGHGSVYGVGGALQDPDVGSTHTITINVQNYGETEANDVVATISSDAGFSVSGSSSQTIGTLSGGAGGSGGSASVSWTVTADSPSDGYIYVTITTSNAGSVTQALPVSVTEAQVGVSGGGGGGGAAAPVITTTTEKGKVQITIDQVPANTDTSITIPATENMPLSSLRINPKVKVRNIEIIVTTLDGKPSDVSDITGVASDYIQIDTTIKDEDLNNASQGFKVPLSWIAEKNIDKESIAMSRHTGGKWNALTTTKESEDSSYVYYSADTPGFSYFGISGTATKTIAPPPMITKAPVTTAPPTAPPTVPLQVTPPESESPVGKIVLVILAIAIIGAAAYYLYGRNGGG